VDVAAVQIRPPLGQDFEVVPVLGEPAVEPGMGVQLGGPQTGLHPAGLGSQLDAQGVSE
jgi:hypothetical protein